MTKIYPPLDKYTEVPRDYLVNKVMEMKHEGRRLAQACAAYVNGMIELTYTFTDDEVYQAEHIRVVMDKDDAIESITPFYPYAAFYENEMSELYGIKIRMIEGLDYKGKLYRINETAPFMPKDKA